MAEALRRIEAVAPMGYGAGIHIRFASPLYQISTFPRAWQDVYRERGFALRDPLLVWGISRTGAIRWSEAELPDPFGVLDEAARHGLRHGASAAVGRITSRTVIGMAHDRREFDDGEVALLDEVAREVHAAAEPPADLDPELIDALRLTAEGFRPREAAAQIGVGEAEFLRRLDGAQATLGAGSTAQAIRLAREYKLM